MLSASLAGAAACGTPGPVQTASPVAEPAGLTPPDGRWLTDADGREYFLDRIARARAVRLDERTVRTAWGVRIETAGEDEQYYYFKVYRGAAPAAVGAPPQPAGGDEKTREGYLVDVPDSDRLAFSPIGEGLPRTGQWYGFAVADLNGDGRPDIALAPARKSAGGPVIFLGDGGTSWRPWREAAFPPLPYDYGDVQVGDLDGDGHLDLALAMHLRGLVALLGDGRGHFTSASRGLDFSADRPGFSSRAIRLVPWTGEGRLDILALGEGPILAAAGESRSMSMAARGVVLYENAGGGSWRPRRSAAKASADVFGDALALGEFLGDGRAGFAAASGLFGFKTLVGVRASDGGWDSVAVDAVRSRAYVTAVAAADFSRRGRSDLVVAYVSSEGAWRSGIDVLSARGDGTWARQSLAAVDGRHAITALSAGDLDGDGHADVVAVTGAGETWVFLGDGRGRFTRETPFPSPFGAACRASRVEIADVTGDGRRAIVTSYAEPPRDGCRGGGGVAVWKVAPK